MKNKRNIIKVVNKLTVKKFEQTLINQDESSDNFTLECCFHKGKKNLMFNGLLDFSEIVDYSTDHIIVIADNNFDKGYWDAKQQRYRRFNRSTKYRDKNIYIVNCY